MTIYYETLKSTYKCANCSNPETPFYLIIKDKETDKQELMILCKKCWVRKISDNLAKHLFGKEGLK